MPDAHLKNNTHLSSTHMQSYHSQTSYATAQKEDRECIEKNDATQRSKSSTEEVQDEEGFQRTYAKSRPRPMGSKRFYEWTPKRLTLIRKFWSEKVVQCFSEDEIHLIRKFVGHPGASKTEVPQFISSLFNICRYSYWGKQPPIAIDSEIAADSEKVHQATNTIRQIIHNWDSRNQSHTSSLL